MPTISQGSNRW